MKSGIGHGGGPIRWKKALPALIGIAILAVLIVALLQVRPKEGLLGWPPHHPAIAFSAEIPRVPKDAMWWANHRFFVWKAWPSASPTEAVNYVLSHRWGRQLTKTVKAQWTRYLDRNPRAYRPPLMAIPLSPSWGFNPAPAVVDTAFVHVSRMLN